MSSKHKINGLSRTAIKRALRVNNDTTTPLLTLQFENGLDSVEVPEKGPAKFNFIAYNGNPVSVTDHGFDHPLVYDIESMIGNQKNPVLYRHKEEVGHTVSINKPGNKQVTGQGLVSIPNSRSAEITDGMKNGFPYQGSLGLDVKTKYISFTPEGKTLVANGREYPGPIYLAKNTRIREVTLTVFGRDEETSFEFLNEAERMRIHNEALRINNEEGTPATTPSTPAAPSTPAKVTATATSATATVNNDNGEIEELRLENEELKKKLEGVQNPAKTMATFHKLLNEFPENHEQVIKGFDEGLTELEIRNSVKLHRYENNMPALPNTTKPKSKDDEFQKSMELRMCLSLDMDQQYLESKFGKEAVEKADALPRLSPSELVVRVGNQIGGNFDAYSDIDAVCAYIKNHYQASQVAGTLQIDNAPGFSTTSLANVLENVSRIQLEERWKLDPPVAPQLCKEASNKDFRPTQKMRVQAGEVWEGVKKDGTIKHTTFGTENFYTTKLNTVAQMLVLDRQTIVNDDMDVISDMMDAMVEGAMMVPDIMMGNLMFEAAGAGLFWVNADNSNTSKALNRTNLSERYKKLMMYNETRGAYIWKNMVNDKWWIVVDPTQEENVFELLKQTVIVGNTTTNTIQGRDNFWAGKFDIKVFPQMANTSLFGSGTFVSANTWFLWPKSAKYAPFIISYLRGRKSPTIERISLPDNILGSGVRGYWDVNVDKRERLVIDRNNG